MHIGLWIFSLVFYSRQGTLTELLNSSRDIRQGDLHSLYLFVLVTKTILGFLSQVKMRVCWKGRGWVTKEVRGSYGEKYNWEARLGKQSALFKISEWGRILVGCVVCIKDHKESPSWTFWLLLQIRRSGNGV